MSNIVCTYDVETLKLFLSEVFDGIVGKSSTTSTIIEFWDNQCITIIHGVGMPLCSNGGICVLKYPSLNAVAERVTSLGLSATMVPQQPQCCIVNAPCQIDIIVYASEVTSSDVCETFRHFSYSSPVKPRQRTVTSTPFYNSSMFQFTSHVRYLHQDVAFHPNSRATVPFESDIFKGHFVFVVRTKPLDPEYSHFFKSKRRMFVFQVQGRFKKVPAGTLYVGVEAQCSLGLLSKSLLRSMLSVVKRQHPNIKYAFGRDASETSYCAAPLFSIVDRLCITPAGALPPDIKRELEEDSATRRSRRSCGGPSILDTQSTYSFSLKGSNIDFCEWSTCGLYMINPTSLSSLLGGSDSFRMTIYAEAKQQKTVRQPSYLLELEISQQVIVGRRLSYEEADSDSEVDEDVRILDNTAALQCLEESEDRVSLLTDEINSDRSSSIHKSVDRVSPAEVAQKYDRRQVSMSVISRAVIDAGSNVPMDWSGEDLMYCPAAVEINDYRM